MSKGMMDITARITTLVNTDGPIIIGLCGRARAGKSTFSKKLVSELKSNGHEAIFYSADWRFKKASTEREQWLRQSFFGNVDEYMNITNQLNWWDFEAIYQDLITLRSGTSVTIRNAYDRKTGEKNGVVKLLPAKVIIYESAILGNKKILDLLDKILFLHLLEWQCLSLAIKTDKLRRNAANIASRFLLTTHSENQYYLNLFSERRDLITVINRKGKIQTKSPKLFQCSYLPIPVNNYDLGSDKESFI